MTNRIFLLWFGLCLCDAALAAHIVTETRVGSDLTGRTDTYANSAGDLRMDERDYGVRSSMSDSANANEITKEYILSDIQDTTLFQVNGRALVSLERSNVCRRMTADSAPPPGLGVPGMNLGESAKQIQDAMKQAGSAFEQAMAEARSEGMSAEQQRAMEQFAKPFMDAAEVKPSDSLDIERMGERAQVGRYSADGYRVIDWEGNTVHRLWVVPTSQVAGGRDVRAAMQGMLDMYKEYLDKMGGGDLMETGLDAMFSKDELADKYPVRIEDIDSGEVTDVVAAHAGGPAVEYYPDCEVQDMFGM